MVSEEKYFEKIKEYKLLAKHEVGQNFLIDQGFARQIVEIADLNEQDKALEIGPGAGSLSYFIAQKSVDSDLIDIDEGLITKLKEDFSDKENIHPIVGNALKCDLSSYTKIIGNLPYYITSSLLERVLLDADSLSLAVLMIQKEAYARIVAKVGSDDYGPLPILLSYRAIAKKEFFVSRSSFAPAPRVDSVVFSLRIKPNTDVEFAKKFYKIVTSLFLHRRKTILNNLSGLIGEKAEKILSTVGIAPQTRPENISVEAYIRLAEETLLAAETI